MGDRPNDRPPMQGGGGQGPNRPNRMRQGGGGQKGGFKNRNLVFSKEPSKMVTETFIIGI